MHQQEIFMVVTAAPQRDSMTNMNMEECVGLESCLMNKVNVCNICQQEVWVVVTATPQKDRMTIMNMEECMWL